MGTCTKPSRVSTWGWGGGPVFDVAEALELVRLAHVHQRAAFVAEAVERGGQRVRALGNVRLAQGHVEEAGHVGSVVFMSERGRVGAAELGPGQFARRDALGYFLGAVDGGKAVMVGHPFVVQYDVGAAGQRQTP